MLEFNIWILVSIFIGFIIGYFIRSLRSNEDDYREVRKR